MKKIIPVLIGILVAVLAFALLQSQCRFSPISISPGRTNTSWFAPSPELPVVKREREAAPFSKIDLNGPIRLFLTQGEKEAITVETHEDLLPELKTEIGHGTLEIRFLGQYNNIDRLNVYLTVRELNDIRLANVARLEGQSTIRCDSLQLRVRSVSRVRLDVDTKNLFCEASGVSRIDLSGKAEQATLRASGSSSIKVGGLKLERGDLQASGASSISIGDVGERLSLTASGASSISVGNVAELSFAASGASRIDYRGAPKITRQNISGASRVRSNK